MFANARETLALMRQALATPIPQSDNIYRAFTQPGNSFSGLQAYDLQEPALRFVPVMTPLRNSIPRVAGGHNIQAEWRAITGINITGISPGVSEGNRGGVIVTATNSYAAAFKSFGLDDYVTFEADNAAQGFDDLKASSALGLLESMMIADENTILGGRGTVALGTTPTPVLAAVGNGGALAAGNVSVICVALSYDAYWAVGGLNNGDTEQSLNIATAIVPAQVVKANIDGTTDTFGGGSAQKSANAVVAVGAGGSITATLPNPVTGAVGYAWYWGAPGAEVLGAVTSSSTVTIAANAVGTQTAASLPASDNSTSQLVFDGMIAQLSKAGSGAYVKALPVTTAGVGPTLTADGAGGIVEWDAALLSMWNNARLSPDVIYLNAQQLLDANKKIISGGGAPLYRLNLDATAPDRQVMAGFVIGSYLNKVMNRMIQVMVHPTMPPGTILFWTNRPPYKLTGVDNIVRIRCRRDYYQMEWPIVRRRYEFGIYWDGVLQNYFPPAFGLITNISAG